MFEQTNKINMELKRKRSYLKILRNKKLRQKARPKDFILELEWFHLDSWKIMFISLTMLQTKIGG